MVNFLGYLPGYAVPKPLDFSPIQQALESNQQNALAQRKLTFDQQRLEMERQRLDQEMKMGQLQYQQAQQMNPLMIQQTQANIAHLQGQEQRANLPEFTATGTDRFGNPVKGFVDRYKQSITPATVTGGANGQAAAASPPGAELPTGDAYLKTLDGETAKQVKALAEGRLAFPTGFAASKPYWQQMVAHVSQYDPSFDAVNYGARYKTRSDFAAGKSAQNISSFNTAISHLSSLYDAIDGLDNSDYPSWNAMKQAWGTQTGDTKLQANLSKYHLAKTAVVDELTRAFRGTGGNVHDLVQWEKSLGQAQSKPALQAAVREGIALLEGRIASLADQYNRGMGTTREPLELLSPKAQDAVRRMQGLSEKGVTNGPVEGERVQKLMTQRAVTGPQPGGFASDAQAVASGQIAPAEFFAKYRGAKLEGREKATYDDILHYFATKGVGAGGEQPANGGWSIKRLD